MQDFPAAHSMDTNWFAVDAEGNIGIFSSGEDGAVPDFDRYSPEDIDEFIAKLPVDSQGIVHLASDGKIAADGADLESLWEDIRYGGTMYELLLVLSYEEVIEELLPDVRLRFSGCDTVVYVDECSAEKIRTLIDLGKIIKGKPWFSLFENAHLLGVFAYNHDWNIPAPYKRLGIPTYPLKFDALPSKLKQEIGQLRFDSIRFAEVSDIQPIEHMPCHTWGNQSSYWLDTKRERGEWEEVKLEYRDLKEE